MIVSIITASYNSENTIHTCMESVLNQDYKEIEYIIVDGKSNDNTISIIKKFKKKYSEIKSISEKDHGIYDALNKGIELAKGDIIGFVHSDDFLASPTIISNIIEKFKCHNCDGVYGDLKYVDKKNINKTKRIWKSSAFSKHLLKKGWMPAHPTLFLKKSIYSNYGTFDLNYKIAADYKFILGIFKKTNLKFIYTPEIITVMRTGGTSNKSLKNIIKKSVEDYKAIRFHKVGGLAVLISKNISKIKQFFLNEYT